MSIKNLRLNPLSIGFLYTKTLVSLEKKQSKKELTDKNFLGNNEKGIVIVVKYTDAVHITDADLDILTKMLVACKLTLNDVALINSHHYTIDWSNLKATLPTQKLILFGITPIEFGMPVLFPDFQLQQYDQTVCLHSPSITAIAQDQLLKSKLWICLQKFFL
jgi:hypothetical protein